MIHYVYSTRGSYLYLLGQHSTLPRSEQPDEFILSVPEKTSQAAIDSLAHKRFMEHLSRPRKTVHERHNKAAS